MVWLALDVTSQPRVSYSEGVWPTLPQLARAPSQLQRSRREMYQAEGPGCCSAPNAPYSLIETPAIAIPRDDSMPLRFVRSAAGSPGRSCQLMISGTTLLESTKSR